MNHSNIPINVNIKPVENWAKIPELGTSGSACFDLHARLDYDHYKNDKYFMGDACQYWSTGLIFEIPKNFAMMIYSRSGDAFKLDRRLSNCVGVIDSDYRGVVKIKTRVDSDIEHYVFDDPNKIIKIAQAMIIMVPVVNFNLKDELTQTTRGANGFGSTG
jgi:dUTP pyrophosphatase